MKRVIGVTGGVGCGKSTVLSILKERFGAEIFMADDVGHEVFVKDSPTFVSIVEHFGEGVLDSSGAISHAALAEIIFRDEDEKEFLDGIVHPYVKGRIEQSIDAWRDRVEGLDPEDRELHLFVLETALMFETGCDVYCDEVWGVITREDVRIERLVSSRGYSVDKARAIIEAQVSDEFLVAKCDRIISNDGSRDELVKTVCDLLFL